MNERDDQALHELLQVWKGLPPDEAKTQQLFNRLRRQMKTTARGQDLTARQVQSREGAEPSNPPRRLWLRRRWVWAPILLILALEGVFAWNRWPPQYQSPRHPLPADNGYLDFIAAGDHIQSIAPELRKWSPYTTREDPTQAWTEAQAIALQVQPALERIRTGLRQPHIVPPHETYTAATTFPYFGPLRELAQQSFVYADVQLVHGDRAGALDTYLLLLELGEQVKHGSWMAHLTGIRIQYIACEGLINSPLAADLGRRGWGPSAYDAYRQAWQREAGRPTLSTEPDWSAAGGRLQRIRRNWVPLREALEAEREASLHLACQVLSHPRPENFFSGKGGDRGSPARGFGWLLKAGLINRRKVFREVETAYERIIAAVDQGKGEDLDRENFQHNNPLMNILLVPWRSWSNRATSAHTMLALLEMQCRAAAKEKGPRLPDPFAPGQPLRERKGWFYSVGPDRRDDGGMPLSYHDFSDREARGDISLRSWFKPAQSSEAPSTEGNGRE